MSLTLKNQSIHSTDNVELEDGNELVLELEGASRLDFEVRTVVARLRELQPQSHLIFLKGESFTCANKASLDGGQGMW